MRSILFYLYHNYLFLNNDYMLVVEVILTNQVDNFAIEVSLTNRFNNFAKRVSNIMIVNHLSILRNFFIYNHHKIQCFITVFYYPLILYKLLIKIINIKIYNGNWKAKRYFSWS